MSALLAVSMMVQGSVRGVRAARGYGADMALAAVALLAAAGAIRQLQQEAA